MPTPLRAGEKGRATDNWQVPFAALTEKFSSMARKCTATFGQRYGGNKAPALNMFMTFSPAALQQK
jgi:hypothetical protein